MHKKRSIMRFLSLLMSAAFVFSFVISCGGGGGAHISAPQQAGISASAAVGAASLSTTVGDAANLSVGVIPPGYAPGKTGSTLKTADIAKIDPRLKDVVDKMMAQLRKPAVTNAMSKSMSFKTMSAPLSAATFSTTCAYGGGGYTITVNTIVTGGTTTTNTLNVSFNNCGEFDGLTYSNLSGSVTGTHVFDNAGYESGDLTVNLTDSQYSDPSFTAAYLTDIYAMNGVFKSIDNNSASGSNSALGSFTWTMKDNINGDTVMTFSFGSGITPVTDVWSTSTDISGTTDIHTGNGTFSLGIAGPGGALTLNITLTTLTDKLITYANLDEAEWFNGNINISWSPDLSQWGCLNGTYTFTTAAGTPVFTPYYSYCPISGTVQVNNATIQFGTPSGEQVTVSLTGGPSQVFPDCTSLSGGGMCGG